MPVVGLTAAGALARTSESANDGRRDGGSGRRPSKPRAHHSHRGRIRSRMAKENVVVLPRPKAHWCKLRCVVRYWIRLMELRAGVNKRLPGITHATRTILEQRLISIVYQGEEGVDEDDDHRMVTPPPLRSVTMPPGMNRFSLMSLPSPVLSPSVSDSLKQNDAYNRDGSRRRGGGSGNATPDRRDAKKKPVLSPGGESDVLSNVAVKGDGGAENEMSMKELIFATMNDPEYSMTAKGISMFILALILVSTTTFIMDTRREYEGNENLKIIEAVCIIVFTIEYVLKISTAPNRYQFFWTAMNMIDLIAILPFYLELIILVAVGGGGGGAPTGLLRLFRLFRVFRVLKLGARMKKLEVVASAVFDSMDMMFMLVFLLVLALVLFSTLIYFCEKGVWEGGDPLADHGGDPFASIPRSFWWCMVTLMTVGYGDAYPVTVEGKIVASLTMIVSVIITALPISVIGANFTQQWIVYKENDAAKARETTMHLTFANLNKALSAHNFVLDEVLQAVEEMEILIEQETAFLKEIFTEATEMPVDDEAARQKRHAMLSQFDVRFEGLHDMREELDELLAFTDLLSSSAFMSMLETFVNKNGRLIAMMNTCESAFEEVDALVRRVNELSERGLDLSDPEGGDVGSMKQLSRSGSGVFTDSAKNV